MRKRNKKEQGFTLIETMVALSILSFTLLGMVSLIIINITNAKHIEKNLIAGNLAQEGLEVVRAMRDNDWLSGGDFGDFLSGDGEYRVQWDDMALRPLDDNPDLDFDSDSGMYNYGSGDATIFKRKVFVKRISDAEISILVTVEWILRSGPIQLQAESHLFDWF
jgi:prepilin-type N-terminal cleavage/methylation domain-containing protein